MVLLVENADFRALPQTFRIRIFGNVFLTNSFSGLKQYLHFHVHYSIIHNSQDMETT